VVGAITAHRKQVPRGIESSSERLATQTGLDFLTDSHIDASHGVSTMPDLFARPCKLTQGRYLDRINVAQARLAGLQDDLGMSDEMWSLGISAFYIGMPYVCGL
jgi:hypothetical protein